MESPLRSVIGALRACLRVLATRPSRVPALEKLARGAVLVPVFGTMLVLLRLRAWLRGPFTVDVTTCYGAQFQCRLPNMIQTYLYGGPAVVSERRCNKKKQAYQNPRFLRAIAFSSC